MLERLAKQTAVYGISTILVRFLSYLLTPYYTRVFGQETYGIVTDVYALIPLFLTLLTMGMESSYFRFAARAEAENGAANDVANKPASKSASNSASKSASKSANAPASASVAEAARKTAVAAAKRRLFATTWGATSLAALLFFLLVALFAAPLSAYMGAAYVAHPSYAVWVAAIVLFDVGAAIPFAKLREEGRSMTYVGLKLLSVVVNVALAFAFGAAGLFASSFGVGWVLVANFAASLLTWCVLLPVARCPRPRIDRRILGAVLVYSLPLLVGGLAGTANEFIDRQLIKYLVPAGAMAQLGIYGAVTKIAVVMMLFYQMYRLAAEPFFLSNFKKEEFTAMNAAALKYYVMASMVIFLAIALFRDLFALIVGRDFREGIDLLPVVLGANVLAGVWLNLSFWYKRAERTSLAILVTGAGLVAMLVAGCALIPRLGYYGAAWARLASETTMVAVSLWLNRRYQPAPYAWGRIAEYVAAALGCFFLAERLGGAIDGAAARHVVNLALFGAYGYYLVRRERIDLRAMARAILKR